MTSAASPRPTAFDAWDLAWELPDRGSILCGRFRIECLLGEGGMSAVFRARDERLGRDVALKLLSPRFAHSREVVQRFVNEARTLARLDSSHIVRVLDAGVASEATPLPYMVLELLHGEDLRGACARGPVENYEVAVDWVLEACQGLAVAHAAGIIHRDLKPENLFLATAADGSQAVKVLDFGVARSLALGSSLTHIGEGVGSPGYMSPEQLNDATAADERSDIWSLGVVLYELLAGAPPFRAQSTFELCAQIVTGRTPHLAELRPDLPTGVSDIVHRCLAVDPNDRFADIAELAEALVEFAERERESAAKIRRRLDQHESGVLPALAEMAAVDARAPTEPAFDDPVASTAARAATGGRGASARTAGWLGVALLVGLLAGAFVPNSSHPGSLLDQVLQPVERATAYLVGVVRQVGATDDAPQSPE